MKNFIQKISAAFPFRATLCVLWILSIAACANEKNTAESAPSVTEKSANAKLTPEKKAEKSAPAKPATAAVAAKPNAVSYTPVEGDILFQSMRRNPFVNAIEGITQSEWSHCGIVVKTDGEWMVLEAMGDVHETPYKHWIRRSRKGKFSVGRLKAPLAEKIPQIIKEGRVFLGRPYDMAFEMSDEALYCSELVYKAVKNATGVSLAKTETLGSLNWKPYEEFISELAQGEPPLEREVITPKALHESSAIEIVYPVKK